MCAKSANAAAGAMNYLDGSQVSQGPDHAKRVGTLNSAVVQARLLED